MEFVVCTMFVTTPLPGNVFVVTAVQLTKSVVERSTQPYALTCGPIEARICKFPPANAVTVKIAVGAGKRVARIVMAKMNMNFFISANVA
jgi:hypothetical protein